MTSTMRGANSSAPDDGEDDEAWIEAQIQRELDALSPAAEGESALVDGTDDEEDIVRDDEEEPPPNGSIPESVARYLETVRTRAQDAEQSLAECNSILQTAQKEADDMEEFAYKSKELNEIAFQLGEDPEELRDRVIQELEEAERKDLEGQEESEGQEVNNLALVPTLNEETGSLVAYTEINLFEKQLVQKVQELEGILLEREEIETRERAEAGRVMAMLDHNAEQHRRRKQQENDEEQRRMAQGRMVQQARIEEEIAREARQNAEELQQYQHNIDELARQTASEREAFEQQRGQEAQRQNYRKQKAATSIQAAFRSYRVRKPYKNKIKLIRDGLQERKENERQMEIAAKRKREEQRKRKEKVEKMKKDEEERKKREEEEKHKEEERKEIQRLERLRIKKEKEEKERAEKERLKREEEKAKKKEELDRQSEEILKRILPDRQKVEQKAILGNETERGDDGESSSDMTECGKESETNDESRIPATRSTESSGLLDEKGNNSSTDTVFITQNDQKVEESSLSSGDARQGQHKLDENQSGGKNSLQTNNPTGGVSIEQTNRLSGGEQGQRTNQTDQSDKGERSDSQRVSLNDQTNNDGLATRDLKDSGGEVLKGKGNILDKGDQNDGLAERVGGPAQEFAPTFVSNDRYVPPSETVDKGVAHTAETRHERDESGKCPYTDRKPSASPAKEDPAINSRDDDRKPQAVTGATNKLAGVGQEGERREVLSDENRQLLTHCPLEPGLEQRRLQWIQECIPLMKLAGRAKMDGASARPRKQLRRPASAKRSPTLTDVQLASTYPPDTPLSQVMTVQLKDLPGCSLSSLTQCQRLRTLTLHNCGVTALESLDASPDILWIDVSHNKVERILCRDRPALACVDASWNVIASAQGLEGCSRLRKLNLSHNKISRIAGLESLLSLTHLDLGHNQLVNISGLTSLVHLQALSLTANHLSSVRGLDQCPLLRRLDLSSNSLSQVPDLTNNVLLRSLSLAGNSLSTLGGLHKMWLPLLERLNVSQNGLTELIPLKSFIILRHFSVCNNFISDVECLIPSLDGCLQLERLDIQGNAVTEESHHRDAILKVLPGLRQLDRDLLTPGIEGREPNVTPSSFEVMCRSHVRDQDALLRRHEAELSPLLDSAGPDVAVRRATLQARHLEEIHEQAVEHRYAHEYGDTSPAAAPIAVGNPKDGTPSLGPQADPAASSPLGVAGREFSVAGTLTGSKEDRRKFAAPTGVTRQSATVDAFRADAGGSSPASEEQGVLRAGFDQGHSGKSSRDVQMNSKDRQAKTDGKQDQRGADAPKAISKVQNALPGSKVDAQTVSKVLYKELKSKGSSVGDRAAVAIQALWRGHSVRRRIELGTKQWLAALKVQAAWRGHRVRRRLREVRRTLVELELGGDKGDGPAEEEVEFGEIDLDSFDFNEEMLEKGWTTPSDTPTLVSKYPPLPPTSGSTMGRTHTHAYPPDAHNPSSSPIPRPYPPSAAKPPSPDKRQPHPPRQAWRGADSPLGLQPKGYEPGAVVGRDGAGLLMKKPPLPPTTPSSLGSTDILSLGSPRTQRTSRQEVLTEEWGFKDSVTADLMMKRARKMAKGKKKKLDPIQRYQQIKKNQEASTPTSTQLASKKGVQRKDYFQAREEEEERKVKSKVEENSQKQHRTFDWVHAQVNDYQVSDSRINAHGIRNRQSNSEPNLPAMTPDILQGSRVSLVSPNGMELQSVESASITGISARGRSHSFSSPEAAERVQFPPIKTSSAPSSHTKQRMAAQGRDRQGGGGMAWGSAGGRVGRGKNGR